MRSKSHEPPIIAVNPMAERPDTLQSRKLALLDSSLHEFRGQVMAAEEGLTDM